MSGITPMEKALTEKLKTKVMEYMGEEIIELAREISILTHLPIEETMIMIQATVIKLTMKNKLILKKVDKDEQE